MELAHLNKIKLKKTNFFYFIYLSKKKNVKFFNKYTNLFIINILIFNIFQSMVNIFHRRKKEKLMKKNIV